MAKENNMNNLVRSLFLIVTIGLLAGCATEPNVPLSDHFWQEKKQKITVATTQAEKPQMYQSGNHCLLYTSPSPRD